MERIGLKSKEMFRKNYLNLAMKLGMVHRRIPENCGARIKDV